MGLQFDPNAIRPAPARRDRIIVGGTMIVMCGLLIFILWAVFSPLHEGVMAPGNVVVEGKRRVIQHLEGGIVKEILVKEGQEVKEGDVLIELEGTQSRANLIITLNRYWVSLAQVTRLTALYNNQDELNFPEELLKAAEQNPSLQNGLAAEREIFKAYREQLRTQNMLYEERLVALQSQQGAKESYLGGIRQELTNLRELEKDRLVDSATVVARQRDYEETRSELNRVKTDIASTRLSLAQSQVDLLEKISRELVMARQELTDLKLQAENLMDVVSRTQIRSPADGYVLNLVLVNPGQVLPPTSAVAEIVPAHDRLIIQGMVPAGDRQGLVEGQKARLRFPSYKSTSIPVIYGTLEFISPDVLQNPSAAGNARGYNGMPSMMAEKQNPSSFYQVRVVVWPEELVKLPDNGKGIQPGMPAQVMLEGKKRNPIAYFLKPFDSLWNNAFTER